MKRESRWPRKERLAQAYADLLRLRIMVACADRAMSPAGFHGEFGGGRLAKVVDAFELLAHYEWLEPVGGADGGPEPDPAERLYRAAERLYVDEATMRELPGSTRALITSRVVETLAARAKRAMQAGTIAARPDHHTTWTPLKLDELGWERMISRMNETLDFIFREQEEARARMEESGEEPIEMTVGLLAFESPAGDV